MSGLILPLIGDPRLRLDVVKLLKTTGYEPLGAINTVRIALQDMKSFSDNIALVVASAEMPSTSQTGITLYRIVHGDLKSPVRYNPAGQYKKTPFILIAQDPNSTRNELGRIHERRKIERDIPPVFGTDFTQYTPSIDEFLRTVNGCLHPQ